MRIKFTKLLAFTVVFINILVIYYSLRLFISFGGLQLYKTPVIKPVTNSSNKHITKLITVIIRDFDLYDNDISLTVQSFINTFPNIQILILYDDLPYPPLRISLLNNNTFNNKNVQLINLSPNFKVSFMERYPIYFIKTRFILFIPDSTRLLNRQILQAMVTELVKNPGNIIAVPFISSKNTLDCLRMNLNTKEWTLKYNSIKNWICDGVSGKHVLLVETEVVKKLSNPFTLPFPQTFYIQTFAMDFKVHIINGLVFQDGKLQRKSHLSQMRRKQIDSDRFKKFYETFGLKQIIRETGTVEWYGCNRDTPRCFGPVLDLMPSYLFKGRWTPPCCLANLRKTAKHVFNCLDEAGIRYWLEAGSLLGAMRSSDILPWDHDVDVGFNRDDLRRSPWLRKASDKPVVDSKGFLWEKATEGNFYRVHYSKKNKIYLNLFPFYSKNGTMSKDSWFTSHKNMEFPENFLHPMSSIEFIGRNVPSPNNIRDFLELKYGKGSIENPEYPDPNILPFP